MNLLLSILHFLFRTLTFVEERIHACTGQDSPHYQKAVIDVVDACDSGRAS